MNRNELLNIIKNNMIKVIGPIIPEDISPSMELKDFGADSIQRVDIISLSIEEAGLNIPLVEFGRAKTIQDIADILYNHIKVIKPVNTWSTLGN